jgi:outer membrane protein assembly factor BamA
MGADSGKVDLLVRVHEGMPTLVTSLVFHWSEDSSVPGPERARVERQALLKQGGPFETPLLNATIGDLRIELLQRGFPLASVQASANVHEGARTAEVKFSVSPGPRASIASIRFEGLQKVPQYMLDREVEFALGRLYSPALTNQVEQSLKAMRVFRWVAVTAPTEVHHGNVHLVVRLSEADPQTVMVGPDLSVEAIRWQQRLTARYTHTNLFGNLTRLDATVVGGYAEIPNPWGSEHHGPVTKVEPAFTKKGILEPFLIWTLAPSVTTDVQEGYQFWSVGDRLGVARWFDGIFNVSLSHNLRRYDYFALSPTSTRKGHSLGATFETPIYVRELKSLFTDSIAKPTEGAVLEATYNMAGGPFFGDYDFHKLVLATRAYYRPWGRLQIVGRLKGVLSSRMGRVREPLSATSTFAALLAGELRPDASPHLTIARPKGHANTFPSVDPAWSSEHSTSLSSGRPIQS